MKMKDYLKLTSTHICVYGEPLSGKSTLVTSVLALNRRVIWISLDSAVEHLAKLPEEQLERLELVIIPDTRINPVAYPTIYRILSNNPTIVCHAHGQHACYECKNIENGSTFVDLSKCGNETIIVIDHLTQLYNSALSIVIHKAVKQGLIGQALEDAVKYFKPEYIHWGQVYSACQMMMELIQHHKCNIVAIAHPVETKIEDGSKRIVPQSGTDKFSNNTSRFFDHTIVTRVASDGEFRVYSKPHIDIGNYIVGSRTGIELAKDEWKLNRFFDGSEQSVPISREYGAEAALSILQGEAQKVAEDAALAALYRRR